MSYSQNDEQEHILEAVGGRVGLFLDVGAYDGRAMSNTLALAECGWAGVLVEPSLHAFTQLLALHGGNPRLKLVHALVGTSRGLPQFFNSDDAVSTSRAQNYERWKGLAHYDSAFYMPQITIMDLFNHFPALGTVDVVNIDTEGSSAELFEFFPYGICQPKVFCIEYDEHGARVQENARTRGYELKYQSNENMVFVRKEE